MQPYSLAIKNDYEHHADTLSAGLMSAYMRNQFAYLGIKSPLLSKLNKRFYAENGLTSLDELDQVLIDLWTLPQREFQYAAINLVRKFEIILPPEFIETIEYMVVTKSWWDTVDTIATNVVGTHFKRYPHVRSQYLALWRTSENIWLRRSAILFQLNYKKDTDFPMLCEIICENLGSKEFFINKAIGWALRQYSRVDERAVRDFVAQTNLHTLSAREALKWLEKKEKVK